MTLRYSLPAARDVSIVVYDIHGRQVARVLEGREGPGEHELTWNGRTGSGQAVGAGTYVIRLTAGDAQRTRKLTFIP